ncbi:MAG: type VI secretion system baseplate subunit TssK [Burkholderiales bacterium]|nr:type VI secretion system baseplate subunit TssK [Pseudomonadota bacterium]MCC7067194.1 type VI secretion system baseplate subunit TssK [Burkholderiales bacterium]
MGDRSRVVWSEGMFLRPQHFQQAERFREFSQHQRALAGEGHFWGFHTLLLDATSLAIGKVAIARAGGVMPDGTAFSFPEPHDPPKAIEIADTLKGRRIYLCLPVYRPGSEEVSFDDDARSLARYAVVEDETPDQNSVAGEPAPIQTAQPRLRLLPEGEVPEGWMTLGVCQVIERRGDLSIALGESFIPPVVVAHESAVLSGFLRELAGLLHHRGEAIAARLSAPGKGGVAEIADFLMLELVNRYEPVVNHLAQLRTLHPERLYSELLALAGDFTTFTRDSRRPGDYPAYNHDDLAACFTPLMHDLRRSLSMVLEQNAFQIELMERAYGVRVAVIADKDLIKSAAFVLAVASDLPGEQVRKLFPTQVKIGPVEKIRDLVNLHLPGVGLRPLPVAPRQIPYHAGNNYFELDTASEFWRGLERSGGLAMHVAGDWPGLKLELWAIRA